MKLSSYVKQLWLEAKTIVSVCVSECVRVGEGWWLVVFGLGGKTHSRSREAQLYILDY